MRYKFWGALILLGLILVAPLGIQAQADAQLDTLTVEIWPEFDRPETLVIYRAELNAATPLPAQLTFRLPGYIDAMHAVAVEQTGGLVDVPAEAIELRHEGDDLFLSFASPSRKIQFEYYDPEILNRTDQERQLDFLFAAPYNTDLTTFQVQTPYQANNFTLTPEASDSFVGQDGLKYYSLEMAGLTPADDFAVTATYRRDTDALSIEQITLNAPLPTNVEPEPPSGPPPASTQTINWGYVLIGAGILLLFGAGGYWWWAQQQAAEPPPHRPRPGRRNKKQSGREPSGGYCYRCGTALRNDADFCHKCGAERRH
jgi:hypothetical protein